jgi:uncharacterized membrane protein YsdA (DUF1294 family)/cold shock CspA family protein
MRFDGHIKSWVDDRGFGFIEPVMGGQEIFVHVKSFAARSGRPQIGQLVSFEVELKHEGQKRAKNVEITRVLPRKSLRRSETPAKWTTTRALAIPVFIALYAAVAIRWHVSPWFAVAYLVLSVICLFVYAADKSAAKAGRWRTPESTLHFFALIGGWPGALLAQQLLRHKSNKPEFQIAFWVTVCINVVTFVAINSSLLPKFYM